MVVESEGYISLIEYLVESLGLFESQQQNDGEETIEDLVSGRVASNLMAICEQNPPARSQGAFRHHAGGRRRGRRSGRGALCRLAARPDPGTENLPHRVYRSHQEPVRQRDRLTDRPSRAKTSRYEKGRLGGQPCLLSFSTRQCVHSSGGYQGKKCVWTLHPIPGRYLVSPDWSQ